MPNGELRPRQITPERLHELGLERLSSSELEAAGWALAAVYPSGRILQPA